jgi:phosphoglycolate phosphatase-like HAD superfamily hydrolase
MRVLLFDIDGTLVHTGGAGGAALFQAFREEFAAADRGQVALSGRTDRSICKDLLGLHGLEDSAENWQRLREAYLQRLPEYLPRYPGRVLPGVARLLGDLAGQADAALGLLTGNLQEGARIKLAHFELDHYFAFGGYGDEHHDRNDVARTALQAAGRYLDGRAGTPSVWVVGDTPLDVACGRAIGARVLAVATGSHSRRELELTHPDSLLDDLSNTEQVLELLA